MLGPFHAAAPQLVLRSGAGWNSSLQIAMQASTVAAGAVSGPDRTTAEAVQTHTEQGFGASYVRFGTPPG